MADRTSPFEDTDTVSLKEVAEEEKELQDMANAVLGDSDDTNCTYTKGYVYRQALYACSTCTPDPARPAGVCLACSLHCHEGHDLYELYTKRNFRCDCGNGSFNGMSCKLTPIKDSSNCNNKYNHNFQGLYCSCRRPYPDEDDDIEDEMLQCVVCEDWHHSRHLGSPPPASYEEMVCDSCMLVHTFLRMYQIHPTIKNNEENKDVNITSSTDTDEATSKERGLVIKTNNEYGESDNKTTSKEATDISNCPECPSTSDVSTPLECLLVRREKLLELSSLVGPGYFMSGWRTELCCCPSCKTLYKSHDVEYLLDLQDSITAYEERARKPQYIHDTGLDVLQSSMGRVQQVEMIHGYNVMKQQLSQFLQRFAAEGKVVHSRDIEDFFGELQASKKQRLDSGEGVPPNHCR